MILKIGNLENYKKMLRDVGRLRHVKIVALVAS